MKASFLAAAMTAAPALLLAASSAPVMDPGGERVPWPAKQERQRETTMIHGDRGALQGVHVEHGVSAVLRVPLPEPQAEESKTAPVFRVWESIFQFRCTPTPVQPKAFPIGAALARSGT